MGLALDEAALAAGLGEVPVGAVVVDAGGTVLAQDHNRRERNADPTAHAELLALRAAGRRLGDWRLDGCTLFVTLEPCAMCAAACVQARVACVVWAAADPQAGFVGSVANLLEDRRVGGRVAWRGGLRAREARERLDDFFANLRGGM
jgi:tRNA(adenine34) deaminase